eukprot:1145176-Pelagomonas_calceolata.AAC.7
MSAPKQIKAHEEGRMDLARKRGVSKHQLLQQTKHGKTSGPSPSPLLKLSTSMVRPELLGPPHSPPW